MWTYLKDVNKKEGMTVFFTTHYMEEAEKNADRIVIIDHGVVVAEGSPGELKKQTKSKSLEEAFLHLTGGKIRNEEAGTIDTMRQMSRVWGGRK
jgi:ABC-2 type transport system ATP-binding protein